MADKNTLSGAADQGWDFNSFLEQAKNFDIKINHDISSDPLPSSPSELRELLRAELSRCRRRKKRLTKLSEKQLVEALSSDACDDIHKFLFAGFAPLVLGHSDA